MYRIATPLLLVLFFASPSFAQVTLRPVDASPDLLRTNRLARQTPAPLPADKPTKGIRGKIEVSPRPHGIVTRPPYPILFVHGLASNDTTWKATLDALNSSFGWGSPFTFHFVLNADLASSRYHDDVRVPRVDIPSSTSLFAVNFEAGWDATRRLIHPYTSHVPLDEQSQSNEAAISKQAFALTYAIGKILESTGAAKVVLVGHSMGGLAIREYLQRKENGQPTWWVDPSDHQAGHRVARVVTYGTPHLGSNTTFPILADFIVDTNSEAVRDLRWEYLTTGQGRYLFGGNEGFSTFFYNTDVNADGDENDIVEGISSGTTYNPRLELPLNIDYTWITARNCGLALPPCVNGDGIVSWDRQWLYEAGFVTPIGFAELLETDIPHRKQPDDAFNLVRGLDEPDFLDTAYELPTNTAPDHFILGTTSWQPSYFEDPSEDVDAYFFETNETASATAYFLSGRESPWELGLLASNANLGVLFDDSDRVAVTFSVFPSSVNYLGLATQAVSNLVQSYFLKIETRRLSHFTPPTGSVRYATVGLPKAVVPTINGLPLSPGDEIGLFTPGGRCAGALIWNDVSDYHVITIWGDDPDTPAVEGFPLGSRLLYRLWQRSSGTEYDAMPSYSRGGNFFSNLGFYELRGLAASTGVAVEEPEESVPGTFVLSQNYPNPFRGNTTISFELPVRSEASLAVYDVTGRLVETLHTGPLAAGRHRFTWNGARQPSGVYFYRLRAGAFSASRPMLLAK